jgi:endonuclease/exonuclease/phosphatase (EEP) superfamily protein YafD
MNSPQHQQPVDPPTPAKTKPRLSLMQRLVAASTWLYCAALLLLWVWMWLEGDRSWLATIFLFGPRWLCALPLLFLVPLAIIWRRRMLWLLLCCALVVVVPIMGFVVHFTDPAEPMSLRVLTCNVEQSTFHVDALASLIERTQPDIVALQEVQQPPPPLMWPKDWHVLFKDRLVVASRHPIVEQESIPRASVPGKLVGIRYLVQHPRGEVQLFNLHLLTPRPGLEAVLDRKRGLDLSAIPQLDAVIRVRNDESWETSIWVASFPGPKIVVGDFNMPADSGIYRDTWSFLQNAFSSTGFGFGFTKITRQHGWEYGTRIDHILYSPPWRCLRVWVGPDIGSDHLPLLADFE